MPLPKQNVYTYADMLTWPEDERMELIDGYPMMMSPPSRAHQYVAGALFAQIFNYLKDKTCQVYAGPFGVRLFEEAGDDPRDVNTVVEPDISVVCDPGKLDDNGCKGAPDLIIEILSPSTARHDRVVKYNLYQKAGVREYWIVDPEARVVLVHRLEEGQYHASEVYFPSSRLPIGVLDDCVIDLSSVFPA